jgi:hypothetical protein
MKASIATKCIDHIPLWSHVEFRPAMLAHAARRGASGHALDISAGLVKGKTFAIDANAWKLTPTVIRAGLPTRSTGRARYISSRA